MHNPRIVFSILVLNLNEKGEIIGKDDSVGTHWYRSKPPSSQMPVRAVSVLFQLRLMSLDGVYVPTAIK